MGRRGEEWRPDLARDLEKEKGCGECGIRGGNEEEEEEKRGGKRKGGGKE